MTLEEKIEKIKKCLALAGGSDNPNEIQDALNMAQRLASSEGISMTSISTEESVEVIKKSLSDSRTSVPHWLFELSDIVANNFKTKAIKTSFYGGSVINIIGTPDDVAITEEIIKYCILMIDKLFIPVLKDIKAKSRRTLTRSDSIRFKNDYIYGFMEGLRTSFTKNVEEYGLVVTQPQEVILFVQEMKLKQVTMPAVVTANSGYAQSKGYEDGKAAGDRNRINTKEER